ncbi:hypothetical protein LMJ53_14455 [Rheinheimera sp. UJ51]|uniref:hypothetical protein n=1 Tax=Rheinheimera sp. UJ51 TaxID=2892446 RepID=UPI001E4757C3|nr:hypothetical protein [Rheinheimera sp. UJ51]MCC5452926.1 hypothetical protein [Rheinheimera sp. UJ51]
MSAVIKTVTPFTNESLLMKALTDIGAEPEKVTVNITDDGHSSIIQYGDIVTNRSDYYGCQIFRFINDRWVLIHDEDEIDARVSSKLADKKYISVSKFLALLGDNYNVVYQQYLEQIAEQERITLEAERKIRVEKTRQQAIAKAKAQGYAVKESINSQGQIQLVLTRMV